MTWDGDTAGGASGLHCYVNGVLDPGRSVINNSLGTNDISNTGALTFGALSYGSTYFNGSLGEISIYDKELSQDEVTALYNDRIPTDPTLLNIGGMVGYWKCGPLSNDGTNTNMEVGDMNGDVPGLTVAGSGFPSDLRTTGPDGYVGYWLMGDGLITVTEHTDPGMYIGYGASLPNTVETINYVMVGIDSGAPDGLFPVYHYWTVQNSPDLTGAHAGSLQYGGPLINIRVSAEYSTITEV